MYLPNVGIKIAAKTFLFPYIPRPKLKQLLQPSAADSSRHPIRQDLNSTTPADVSAFVRFGRAHRSQLLPIYDDLQMRIALRLLPVRSRFWFLMQQDPTVQQCPYSTCNNIETAKHLFMECAKSKAEWATVWKDWSRFLVGPLTWTSLVLPHKQQVAACWYQ
ncbi:hypothetical protein PHYSODRAFT_473936 [Phytophthora sojae]|uniref:Reverse transcriptase zinc-binding domain-containing protein n=1 Tax=Phytophthora sojae (strain P6497) TaxID=1094619 RepID=G4YMN8_PHYSP|nr:hypothetical protein PHYSODRAFT_473936 [Phytophthora sojae]EGZ28913.1 hypothetical protein PHYSODRAFT_473936 [Phytophthora sojae]|eukprot:XP_009516188.1 hypothetical protein PHYSODRAFT_473936 [Phytophthora sojae]